jgi:hypothetical protein
MIKRDRDNMHVPQNDDAKKDFLKKAKELVSKCHRRFQKRKEYDIDKELAKLDILSTDEAWRFVLQIKVKLAKVEYDRDDNTTLVWFFKKEVNGKTAYIKLKIDERGCLCMAFHPWNRTKGT